MNPIHVIPKATPTPFAGVFLFPRTDQYHEVINALNVLMIDYDIYDESAECLSSIRHGEELNRPTISATDILNAVETLIKIDYSETDSEGVTTFYFYEENAHEPQTDKNQDIPF